MCKTCTEAHSAAIATLQAEVKRLTEERQWQPIETAPPTSYGGDHLLTLCSQGAYPPFQIEAWKTEQVEEMWQSAAGWVRPFHWMPLPPLPEG